MRNYLIRRTLQSIPIILGAMLVSFIILSLVSDPFAAMMENPKVKLADIERLRKAWGFDLPVYLRFFKWFGSVLTGNWGPSLLYPGYSAREIIFRALPITLQVMGLQFIFSLIVSIPLGIISAIKQYSKTDYTLTFFSFFGMSMPTLLVRIDDDVAVLCISKKAFRCIPSTSRRHNNTRNGECSISCKVR